MIERINNKIKLFQLFIEYRKGRGSNGFENFSR